MGTEYPSTYLPSLRAAEGPSILGFRLAMAAIDDVGTLIAIHAVSNDIHASRTSEGRALGPSALA